MSFLEAQPQVPTLVTLCVKVVCKLISEKPRKLEGLPQDILTGNRYYYIMVTKIVLLVNSVINDNTLYSLTTGNLREFQLMVTHFIYW
jgi:hypothetical protein